ncbi:hypothetical protein PCE1_000119 [Barthelona sp. PCE]
MAPTTLNPDNRTPSEILAFAEHILRFKFNKSPYFSLLDLQLVTHSNDTVKLRLLQLIIFIKLMKRLHNVLLISVRAKQYGILNKHPELAAQILELGLEPSFYLDVEVAHGVDEATIAMMERDILKFFESQSTVKTIAEYEEQYGLVSLLRADNINYRDTLSMTNAYIKFAS